MMPGITVLTGGVLIAVGVIGWWPHHAATALIPAYLGGLLALLGLLSFKPGLRKHTMLAAAAVALLGFIGCAVMAGPLLPKLLSEGKVMKPLPDGGERDATAAVTSQAVTGLVCLVFVILCVNSFVQARLLRKTQGGPAA